MPPVGSLRDRVQLQKREMAPMPGGGHETMFFPMTSVWARVRSRSARIMREGDGRAATSTHAVTLRFRKDVSPGDRIVYRGRALEVVEAEDINGRKAYLDCLCVETAVVG
ncbi:phage head-tail adaptor, putative, SPP1 family [Pelagibacterium luteolum]|uniref:Phage head-tail adaptor, putative, SPP1 family n=1 Tax=Pelagibacterium luteolum TaxID=440168 RepID=A0A1G7TNK3_9HYPH|nr:phage head closure protein [Pelagibacterium luteolum]SDG36907.1 phage head-tail adaptor, putative, SPP1 family [Pelagibacterium luteolum]